MPPFWKAAAAALAPLFKPSDTAIEGINPADWASPMQPIRPVTQISGVRSWDFTPGINLQFTPRGDTAIKFPQLVRVANSFDLCRLMIERRKNQIVNRPWQIRVKPKPGEHNKDRLKREASTSAVAEITKLFQFPDGVHTFDKWIRMWLEQLYVFDAPCIYPVRNRLGEVMALRIISGATITPLVDAQGFTPLPPNPAYQQIILGVPVGDLTGNAQNVKQYTVNELIYSPKNPRVDSRWGFGPVEQIITTLAIASNRQSFLLDYYRSGNVPEGLLPMPEGWSASQIKDFQKWFDNLLAGNLAKKRRLIAIPDTKHPAQFSKEKALTDGTDEYLARVVAFAFGESPQALSKQVGHQSTAKEGNDTAQETGLEPDLKHIEVEMNRIISLVLQKPDVEFAFAEAREVDPLKQAQTDKIYLSMGAYTINEIREARGDDPRPEKEADALGIVTPQGFMPVDANAASDRAKQMQPQKPEPGAGKPPAEKIAKRAELRAVAGELTPRARHIKDQAQRFLTGWLAEQGKRIARQAREGFEAHKAVPAGGLTKDDTERDVDNAAVILGLLDWSYRDLAQEMAPYLQDAAEEGVHAGAWQTATHEGVALDETTSRAVPAARSTARARALEMSGLELKDDGTIAEATGPHWAISTTAKDDVLNTIKQAIKEDWTPSQLEAVLQASAPFSADRAAMIADNEISHQQMQGHIQAWKASRKVAEVAWQCADLGCCPECAAFSAQGSVPVGHAFAPGIHEPGAHPNCRCSLVVTKYAEE